MRLVFASARPCSLYFCPSSRVGCIVVIGMPSRDSHGMESPVASPMHSITLSRNKSCAWDSKIMCMGLHHERGTPTCKSHAWDSTAAVWSPTQHMHHVHGAHGSAVGLQSRNAVQFGVPCAQHAACSAAWDCCAVWSVAWDSNLCSAL